MAANSALTRRTTQSHLGLLRRLSEAGGVSGDEGAVRRIVRQEIEACADHLEVDALGNLLVLRHGTGRNRLRVMVAAHLDEVGLMIMGADGEGLLLFETVGGIDPRQLPGKPVRVGRRNRPGVIAAPPVHHPSDRGAEVNVDSLRIDIGVDTREEALEIVPPGEWAVFATPFVRLGPTIRGKALDDRLGVATLIELVREPPAGIDLLAAFTVQEEIGCRGAPAAACRLEPDAALILDATPANDLPTWDGEENTTFNAHLGSGATIYVADRGTISDRRLVEHLAGTAEAEGIPYQLRQPGGGSTDASAIHLVGAGIPSISLSVPVRYAHTAASLASLADWRSSARLAHAALSRLRPAALRRPQGV
jgi:putative aminopeptidase FrvX